MSVNDLYDVLLGVLVAASVLDWFVAWILWRSYQIIPSPVLRERLGVAIVTAFVVSGVTIFGVAFEFGLLPESVPVLIARRLMFIGLGIIPLRFLYLIARGRL